MQTISIDINKVQKGDEAEFRLLFNLFYPRLMSVACRFVPEHIAEDIVQSVFVMYWEQKSTLIPNAIHSFLYKCTQNNCLNYLKHQVLHPQVVSYDELNASICKTIDYYINEDPQKRFNGLTAGEMRKEAMRGNIKNCPIATNHRIEGYWKTIKEKKIREAKKILS